MTMYERTKSFKKNRKDQAETFPSKYFKKRGEKGPGRNTQAYPI